MIRWYDSIAAVVVAYGILYFFFTLPIIGAIVAYMMYEHGWSAYCQFRWKQEYEK